MDIIKEFTDRGLLHSKTEGLDELLKNNITFYIGFDPTADSLHVGSLAQIINLIRLEQFGHRGICVIGGATGMIGDPSGKSKERNLLNIETLQHNVTSIQKQLTKLVGNECLLLNNLAWTENFSFLEFIRDIGKYLNIAYMLNKDSVKSRLETGLSFTEFSYQLLQAYDFYFLYNEYNCNLQLGGSDQWGNILSGIELINKKIQGNAHGLTTHLIKKADGTKFGKSESGNIWLDSTKTSVYKFYQFWLNTVDADVENFLKIFTFLSLEEISSLKGLDRQKILARELTIFVHGELAYLKAVQDSETLFKGSINDIIEANSEIFEGLQNIEIQKLDLNILDFLVLHQIYPSKNEARKMILAGGFSINKQIIKDIQLIITSSLILNNNFILLQKGKRNYIILKLKK